MDADAQTNRFTQVARQELQSGSRREPIWNEAYTTANGNEASAQNCYVELRVKQMLADEAETKTAHQTRRERQALEDQQALSTLQKLAILGTGIIIGLALGIILMHRL